MSSSIEKIIEQKETKDFLVTARDYCSFIELTTKKDKEFLRQVQDLLLKLYQEARSIPLTTVTHDEDVEVQLSKEASENILRQIADKIGADRFYWTVFDPTDDKDTEAVCGDLVDDLGDIYKDIKRSLLTFDQETLTSKEDAIWSMKFGFEKHWGQHAIDALRTIHFLLEE
jgi:hypothetical protein